MEFTTMLGILAFNWLVSNILSWALVEWKRPLFQFKPFSCRPCMAFWLTCIIGGCLFGAILTAPLLAWLFIAGAVIVTALLNYYIINSKIQIHE